MEERGTEKDRSDLFADRFVSYRLLPVDQQNKIKPLIRKFYNYRTVYFLFIWFLLIVDACLIVVAAVDSTKGHFDSRIVTDIDITIAVTLLFAILGTVAYGIAKFELSQRIEKLFLENKVKEIDEKQLSTDQQETIEE